MYNADVGARVTVRRIPEDGYSARLHNEFAGMTGTVTQRFGCPSSVVVVFDSAIMRNGLQISSGLYSLDRIEPETKERDKQ